jgi:hypothetical protein
VSFDIVSLEFRIRELERIVGELMVKNIILKK